MQYSHFRSYRRYRGSHETSINNLDSPRQRLPTHDRATSHCSGKYKKQPNNRIDRQAIVIEGVVDLASLVAASSGLVATWTPANGEIAPLCTLIAALASTVVVILNLIAKRLNLKPQ